MLNSSSVWSHCTKAVIAMQQGRYEEAERDLIAANSLVETHGAKRHREIVERYITILRQRSRFPAERSVGPAVADTLLSPAQHARATPQDTKRPAISLVTSVFNRFWQLKETLPTNLKTVRDHADIELVLVDFGGSDSTEIQAYIEEEFSHDVLSGRLSYYILGRPWTRFHMAAAKNATHRLSKGDFIFSLDADNFFLPEDLVQLRAHIGQSPDQIFHQTTGAAPLLHAMWRKYELCAADLIHEGELTWDGSCGRVGVSRKNFERANGYNENFKGMGMDDLDFLIRSMKLGSSYQHYSLTRSTDTIFIDNGTADKNHVHTDNSANWSQMDEAVSAGRFVPHYCAETPVELFRAYTLRMVSASNKNAVTLFCSAFRIERYLARFLNDLGAIAAGNPVCVWVLDVVDSNPPFVSAALRAAADGRRIFYSQVRSDPGLYALWNQVIGRIGSEYIGNLNADDLRGRGWLAACLAPLQAGVADVASPITVPFRDASAIDYESTLASVRNESGEVERWFDARCEVLGEYPNERVRMTPLVDGEYSHEDLFQVLPNGSLASYCIPNASALWRRSIHDLAGHFDEDQFGSFADLAVWAKAGFAGARFRQVPYNALFFLSEDQAHKRQAHDEGKLVHLATRYGAENIARWTTRRMFDFSPSRGSYGDHHFKGWNWVRDELERYFESTSGRVLLDMFVERTFFWNPDPAAKDFEYEKPWVGFVHTTPHANAAFDLKGQNLDCLLAEPRFLRSLAHCKGLVVLSQDNLRYLRDRLVELGIPVNVYCLFHPNIPMDDPQLLPSIDLGSDSEPKIFHVGWHLRSFSSFARLDCPRERKVLLIPKNLSREYFLDEVVNKELRLSGLQEIDNYVSEIYTASQDDYVHILRKAIVFNDYVQPAGSNLISECISAGARLVINRHAAFEEYLGADYPLFYESLSEAASKVKMACQASMTEKIQRYLRTRDESRSIQTFCREVERIGKYTYTNALIAG